jgi:hypothetical protein
MSWRINLIKNEVIITTKIADELLALDNAEEYFGDIEEVDTDYALDYLVGYMDDEGNNRLYFNPDNMEHMDYVSDKNVQNVLMRHKVSGDICFSSENGDNAGTAWGYRFDGKGGMIKLEGVRQWIEVGNLRKAKKK